LSASEAAAVAVVPVVELMVKGATFDNGIRFCCVALSAGNVTVITCLLADPTVDSVSDTKHNNNVITPLKTRNKHTEVPSAQN
jgi:hypothetical protein